MRIQLCSLITVLAAFLLLQGCATTRTAGWDKQVEGAKLSSAEVKEIWNQAEKHWGKRDDAKELKSSLEMYEKLASSNPDDYKVLTKLCRGYYLLADGHTDDETEKKRLWEIGTGWGEKAMATNSAFKKKVSEQEGKIELALDVLTKDQIESIYWTAVNLGKWAKLSGIATMLKYKARIKDMINRVGELDRKFFYGAFDRYWGVYYAVAPGFAGGDLNKSDESFKKSISEEVNYLGTYVLIAENYATKKGDKDLFKEKLNWVLKASPEKIKDIAPENRIEQVKAKKLLDKMNELF
jgi:hypothetical protein